MEASENSNTDSANGLKRKLSAMKSPGHDDTSADEGVGGKRRKSSRNSTSGTVSTAVSVNLLISF